MTDQAPQVEPRSAHGQDCDCGCHGSSKKSSSAGDILDRRYASGEITRDQYEHMKEDLGLSSSKTANGNKGGCC